jgi:hypothetical protein
MAHLLGVIFTAKKIGTKKGEDKIAFGQFTCSEGSYVYWWAIFDGHNGSECSEYVFFWRLSLIITDFV